MRERIARIRRSFCGQNANIDTIHLLQLTANEPTKSSQAKRASLLFAIDPEYRIYKTPCSDKISIRSFLLLFVLILFVYYCCCCCYCWCCYCCCFHAYIFTIEWRQQQKRLSSFVKHRRIKKKVLKLLQIQMMICVCV